MQPMARVFGVGEGHGSWTAVGRLPANRGELNRDWGYLRLGTYFKLAVGDYMYGDQPRHCADAKKVMAAPSAQ